MNAMTQTQIEATLKKEKAAIFCGICFEKIFCGRKIFEKAYKALQRHILIDHATNGEAANGRCAGTIFFKENGSSWTMRLGINTHEWNEGDRIPRLVRAAKPFPSRYDTLRSYKYGYHESEETLEGARAAFDNGK